MSYIRFGQQRVIGGTSNVYVYPTSWDEDEGASIVVQGASEMTEMDLAELAIHVIERTDLDEDAFEDVVAAVWDEYPQFDEPLSGFDE